MFYGDFKDLPRKKTSEKVLGDKVFDIAKIQKYDGCQCELALMAYKFFDKRSAPVHSNNSAGHKGTGINSENEQLEE